MLRANAHDAHLCWLAALAGDCYALATTGFVTVTSAAPPWTRTFDLTFVEGHVTGSIQAPNCDALDPNSTQLGFYE
ncbi:hypothetical protein BH11MYX2_BH11MYX2_41030 [soil metagenome]